MSRAEEYEILVISYFIIHDFISTCARELILNLLTSVYKQLNYDASHTNHMTNLPRGFTGQNNSETKTVT